MTEHSQPAPGPAALTVVTVSSDALASISDHAGSASDELETGGILLGNERRGRLDIKIAGGPGPNAVHTSTQFRRDLEHAKRLSVEAYDELQANWIGEWHTHPHGPHHPSHRDLRTYRQLIAEPELNLTVLVALIVLPLGAGRHLPQDARAEPQLGCQFTIWAWVIDTINVAAATLHLT
jgi:integrative and conjugative element protein (TIGR02256 family)